MTRALDLSAEFAPSLSRRRSLDASDPAAAQRPRLDRLALDRRRLLFAALGLLCAFALSGCSRSTPGSGEAPTEPLPIGDAPCATCGMVVAQQPAPRGQLVHRDGTRAYFCSMSDLVAYVGSPSAHGKPKAIFVETLDASAAPAETSLAPRPWAPAESAGFVVGVARAEVMGKPTLAYATRAEAEAVAKQHGGTPSTWVELQKQLP